MSSLDAEVVAEPVPAPRSRRERRRQAWRGRHCANCGAELQGPFCHACGQPAQTPLRELTTLTADAFEYLLDVDARVWKTIRDLFFRPGRLTEAYLAGRRMSFVKPLRLYLVASALLFLGVGMTTEGPLDFQIDDTGEPAELTFGPQAEAAGRLAAATSALAAATTPEERAAREKEVEAIAREMEAARTGAGDPVASPEAEGGKDGKEEEAKKSERKPISMNFNGQPWHRTENPLVFEPLPQWANDTLNDYIGVIRHNLELVRSDPKLLGAAFLRVLPQSLFVLLPIFALLLKAVFLFKRRLYLEHLMVAVHSHTFIYLGIVVAMTLHWIEGGWPHGWSNPFGVLFGLCVAWIPLNLLLTQKRVYQQGWIGALIAYFVIGILYTVLFALVAVGALVASLVNL